MKFYIVDAFAEKQFGGNPAGVVILEEGQIFPDEKTMLRTAAELRYSETAFVRQLGASLFELRYFTPAAEVELCGHATIASFAALLDAGLAEDGCQYTARTLAGELKVELRCGSVMMEMGAPEHLGTISGSKESERLYTALGLSFEPIFSHCGGQQIELLPAIVSTGLPDIILPVRDRETLASIAPDFPALSRLSEEYNVTGVHAFFLCETSSPVTACCRNFAPLYGIDEEAATGTASGALAYYLYTCGLMEIGQEYTFVQGEAMDRPSRILSQLCAEENGPLIRVGGGAAILAKGELLL